MDQPLATSQLWYWDRDCWQWRWSLGWRWRWGQGAPSLRKSCQVTQNNCSPHITSCPPMSEQETSKRQGKGKSKSKDKCRQAHRWCLSIKFCDHRFWGKKITLSYIWNGFYTWSQSKVSLLSPLIIGSKLTFWGCSSRWLPYSTMFRVTSTTMHIQYKAQTIFMCKTRFWQSGNDSRWFLSKKFKIRTRQNGTVRDGTGWSS